MSPAPLFRPTRRGRRSAAGTVVGAVLVGSTVLAVGPAGAGTPALTAVTTRTTATALTTVTSTRGRAPTEGPLLEPLAADAKRPTTAGLRKALSTLVSDPALGRRVSVTVRDSTSGKVLYGKRDSIGFTPASVTKLLTTTAALSLLGPDHRFATRVALEPAANSARSSKPGVSKGTPPTIVLVGGGDPLLASKAALVRTAKAGHVVYPDATTATIDDLARSTAAALQATGHSRVHLAYDDSLFGQPVSPHWRPVYVASSVVAPVSALWVDEARVAAPYLQRAADPSLDAASRFSKLLAKRGIDVVGTPTAKRVGVSATNVASVSSAPLSSIVEHVLLTSDNDGAEVLARQAAIASGRKPDFAGGAAAVLARLRKLGIDTSGVRLYDGSGLSRDDVIPGDVLTSVIGLAVGTSHPELSPLLAGLPVAAFNGSLATRFVSNARAGAGFVRAKTGTLTGVSSLAGTVVTRDGALLTFAVMADRIGATDARPVQDRIAATLAACGCR